ncbi:TetR/AcrR family transcriptional regulator [Paracoccus sp. MBLB3053]|uniref:TetR/AcrR family transcriptional regulator n=1 Tax=Paracoccus aurantius TaxID=3073814 RepID=A0ABU2HXE6_9RHOB|nr:TetR/AcrR family transcriptional regulator [Paracoccus sp. MBLB3053]MDS9469723.1 TetR/AcrR family transcriptional regulator [Paracoccus sp. MBLB3053]
MSNSQTTASDKPARRTRRPGRPEGQTNLADEILDAAEIMFAELGYSGTTLRQVAEKLGVTPAMIAYYFQSKDNLFRAVFLRRGQGISDSRMERLSELEGKPGKIVEDLVRAFIEPSARLYGDQQGRAFLRLHARLHMEPEALSFELRRTVYNESTRAYARAFAELLPQLSEREIYQRMSLLIGAYLYAFSGTSRLGEFLVTDEGESTRGLTENIIAFGTAGMMSRSNV